MVFCFNKTRRILEEKKSEITLMRTTNQSEFKAEQDTQPAPDAAAKGGKTRVSQDSIYNIFREKKQHSNVQFLSPVDQEYPEI